ncbi:hypothetical protein GGI26_001179 [Coemansia sp. RSA 1358]|nr:hypothetical protein EDC05_000961 [Coemansia umbellata]KAJ2624763.1 hypothetical protein GGI26_001179 [Coemansia sp. RSA 1358]
MSMEKNIDTQQLHDLCDICAEYKQKSPHPSRPHIQASVDISTWSNIHVLFQKLLPKDAASNVDEDEQALLAANKYNALSDLCIFVRNAAAMDPSNQNAIDKLGVMADVKNTVSSMLLRELTHAGAMKCATLAAQALSNTVTKNKVLQEKLIRQEFSVDPTTTTDNIYSDLLASVHQKTNTAGLVLLLNSIKGNSDLVKLLCTTDSGKLVARRLGIMFGSIQDDDSEEKEVLYALLAQIIENKCLTELVRGNSTLDMYGLLESFAVYCGIHADSADTLGQVFDKELVCFLGDLLGQERIVLIRIWQGVSSNDASQPGEKLDMDSVMAAHRCLAAVVSILGTATSNHSQKLVDWLIECKVIHRVVELLGFLNINLPRIQSLSDPNGISEKHTNEDQGASVKRLFMFKRDLIQIIGNSAYKNKDAQDLIRELDGLSLVLDNMRIDDNHPFIKEYAVVALKWLLEDNMDNQIYVKDMEVIKPVLDPSITAPGVDVSVDDNDIPILEKSRKQGNS